MTIGSHQTPIGKNDERFTPPKLWKPLAPFDTDPATGIVRPWSIGRKRNFTVADDCLTMDWRGFGFTWLNPPFNRYGVAAFILKMCGHDNGVMLLHHRHDTQWWQPINDVALLALEVAGRIIFHKADGSPATIDNPKSKHFGKIANSGAPVTLFAFGVEAADRLAAAVRRAEWDGRNLIWPDGGIPGCIKLIRFQRGWLILALSENETAKSWRAVVADWLCCNEGPVPVSELYRAFRQHPKSKQNPNWKAKLRQTLQRGAGKSVGRDQWVAA